MNKQKMHLIATTLVSQLLEDRANDVISHVSAGNTLNLLNRDVIRKALRLNRINSTITSNDTEVIDSILNDSFFRMTFRSLIESVVSNINLY